MGVGEWVLAGLVVVIFVFVILRPDRWGKRDSGSGSEGGFYAADGRRRDDDNNGDGGGDGD
jgi:hypothetical protein